MRQVRSLSAIGSGRDRLVVQCRVSPRLAGDLFDDRVGGARLAAADLRLAIGVAVVAGHNLFDPIVPEDFGPAPFLWRLRHEGGPIAGVASPIAIVLYPILPWVGVMTLGYGCGPLFTVEPARRDRLLPAAGLFDGFRKAVVSPNRPQGLGFQLPVVFAARFVVLVLLYPSARWFASVKARRRDWWLSYL